MGIKHYIMWNSWSRISQRRRGRKRRRYDCPLSHFWFSEGRHDLVPLVGESVNPAMFALATTVLKKATVFIGQPGRPLRTFPAYFTFNLSPPPFTPNHHRQPMATDGWGCLLRSRCMDDSGRYRRFSQPPSWHVWDVGKPYNTCKLTFRMWYTTSISLSMTTEVFAA